jgi:uncharacterized integral membrane protein (TIGR00698 family)
MTTASPPRKLTTPAATVARHAAGRAAWLALLPGVALCVAVTLAAQALELGETRLFGRAWLEALVLAILVGTAVRTAWTPGRIWTRGIGFSAKTLLEIAVVLLGASISAATILAAGAALLVGIAAIVAVAICASFAIGRLLGLPVRMALLVACGNSICGNSAIAAVAPVIGADSRDVAASIAFTAVLGVAVVLGLPLLVPLLHLSLMQYGVMAGLTVYAVPQVLAATAPVGALAVQIGTLVKLVRVLMLGPVVLVLSLLAGRIARASGAAPPPGTTKLKISRLIPWFILGFLALVAMRSLGLIPPVTLAPIALVANLLTVVAMAALGLGTDLKVVARAGGPVTAAVSLSLLLLGLVSFGLIRVLGIL